MLYSGIGHSIGKECFTFQRYPIRDSKLLVLWCLITLIPSSVLEVNRHNELTATQKWEINS